MQGTRWWEFYAVRYAQGTVAGAVMLHILIEKSPLKDAVPFLAGFSGSNVYLYLVLLLVCGLAYSYIASGPVLVMHAARGLMLENKFNRRALSGWVKRGFLLLFFYVAIVSFFYFSGADSAVGSGKFFLLSPYSLVVSFQLVFLHQILFARVTREVVQRYYVALLKKRKELEESEYIESYRHLREHGNSFFIVMFQIFFAMAIWEMANASSLIFVVSLFLLWVVPPSFIWFFGNVLENNLLALSHDDLLAHEENDGNRKDEKSPMNSSTGVDSTKEKENRGLISCLVEKLDENALLFFFSLAFSCVLLLAMIIATTVIVVLGKPFETMWWHLLLPVFPILAVFVFFIFPSLCFCLKRVCRDKKPQAQKIPSSAQSSDESAQTDKE